MKTFLITGISGFVGSALAEQMLKNDYKVIGVTLEGMGFLNEEIADNKDFSLLETDLSRKFDGELEGTEIDGIIHLASQQPSSDDLTYEDFYKGNVKTTLNVMDLARKKDVEMVVYTSTTTVLGRQFDGKPVNECSFSSPASYYGLTKFMAERLLEIGLNGTKTKTVIFRFPSIMGKNNLGGLTYTYYQLANKGDDIEVYGKGQRRRNLLYIDDAVDVLVKAIDSFDKLEKFSVFTVGSKDSLKMAEIARLVASMLDSDSKVIKVDKKPAVDRDVLIDISKAKEMLKFDPMTIEEGLKVYVKEMKDEI